MKPLQPPCHPPRCPRCGSEVVLRQLVVEDEGDAETVYLIDCVTGDFSVSVTEQQLNKVITKVLSETVMARLRRA